MKAEVHPQYHQANVHCVCGNEFTVGSTTESIRVEVCNKCHPFFTGQQQRLVDREGQVDRFYRKLQALHLGWSTLSYLGEHAEWRPARP